MAEQMQLLEEVREIEKEAAELVQSTIASFSQEVDQEVAAIRELVCRRLDQSQATYNAIRLAFDHLGSLRNKLEEIGLKAEADIRLYSAMMQRLSSNHKKAGDSDIPQPEFIRPNEFAGKSTREAALSILRQAKRPLFTKEIARILQAGGKKFRNDPSSTVSGTLNQAEEFVAIEAGGKNKWKLKEWEQ